MLSLNKKLCVSTLSALSLFGACAANAQQSEKSQGVYLGVFADYYFAHWNPVENKTISLGESLGMGLDLGYRFNDTWSARLEYAYNNFYIKNSDQDKSGQRYGADALYHFGNSGFYALAGLKRIDVYDAFSAANLGLGGHLDLSEKWSVNSELAWYESLADNDYSDVGVKLGVVYSFADANKSTPIAAAPAPQAESDSDNDGVVDSQDKCLDSASNDLVDATGCVMYKQVERIEHLEITFANDEAIVTPSYFASIEEFAAFINEYKDATAVIVGHTSQAGAADYNLALSQKRAEQVKTLLVEKYNVDSARLSAVGKGETELKNTAGTEEAAAQNRRVEAHLTITERVKMTK